MAYDPELAGRIRHLLREAGVSERTREQKMFGGLSFLVDDAIAVTANNHGDLLARCDPDEVDTLRRVTERHVTQPPVPPRAWDTAA